MFYFVSIIDQTTSSVQIKLFNGQMELHDKSNRLFTPFMRSIH